MKKKIHISINDKPAECLKNLNSEIVDIFLLIKNREFDKNYTVCKKCLDELFMYSKNKKRNEKLVITNYIEMEN